MNDFNGRIWFTVASIVLVAVCTISTVLDTRFWLLPKPSSDGPIYENMAYNLNIGRGFWLDWQDAKWREPYEQSSERDDFRAYLDAPPQSMPMTGRPPLFPALVAIVYKFVDRGPIAFAIVRITSALCLAFGCAIAVANAATVMKLEVYGRKFSTWSIALGCAAAILLAASNRTLLSYANDFLTEPLALLLTQLLVAALLAIIHNRDEIANSQPLSLWMIVTIGVVVAGMILVRSLFVLWLPGLWLLLLTIRGSHRLREATSILVVAVVCLSPWWIRNCIVLDRFMPLGTQGPITLLGGYCDEALTAGGDWQHAPEQRLRQAMREDEAFMSLPNDVARELLVAEESKRLVRAWINNHISDLPKLFIARVVTHWNPYTGKSLVWRLLILAGAVYLVAKRRPEAWVLIGLPVMNTVLVASLYTTGGRFLVPLYGILFTLSAIGVASLAELARAFIGRKS